jgi:hypothetical protein
MCSQPSGIRRSSFTTIQIYGFRIGRFATHRPSLKNWARVWSVTSLGVKLLLLQNIFVGFHFSIFFFLWISGYHSCCYEEFQLWYIMPRSPGKDSRRFGRTIFTVKK